MRWLRPVPRPSRSCSCSRSSTTRMSGAREKSSATRHPDVFVSLSSEVDPAFREYERTVVTAFDAYVKPVVDRYLANLDSGLLSASRAGAAAGHAVARRHFGIADRAAAPGAPVSLRPRGRCDRRQDGGRNRRRARPDHRRCRRHLMRHRADRGRHARTALRRHDRRLSGARRHGRRQFDRFGRRLDRMARRRGGPARRSAVGRARSRGPPATAAAAWRRP